jgi:DNA-binding MarR family transcriptional regulator
MNALDKKLSETEQFQKENWIKLIAILKRQSQDWATDHLIKQGYSDFKMAYMPVFMNIPPDGIRNNDLANHARVTKQAMSKVAKDLQKLGYIKSKADRHDKRSTIFMLTDRGKKLVVKARACLMDLTNEYRSLVGNREFDQATEVLKKIIAHNDQTILARK